MNIYRQSHARCNMAIAIGNFDGIHLGHRHLLTQLVSEAKIRGLEPAIFSFYPHPRTMLTGCANHQLSSFRQRINMLEEIGIRHLFLSQFNQSFSGLSAERFLRDELLARCKAKLILIGEDFRFGHKASGDAEFLKQNSLKFDYELIIISPYEGLSSKISSSTIRTLIANGKPEGAAELLGRNYIICGRVVKGQKLAGNLLGYKTANISLRSYVKPLAGVYRVAAHIPKRYNAIANFGIKPTLTNDGEFICEIHLLNFNDDLYGKKIEVELLSFIRPEKKFMNLEALKKQIALDIGSL